MDRLLTIWPTVNDVAEALKLPYQTVAAWKRRGVPPRRVPEIIRCAKAEGHDLSFEDLIGDDDGATQPQDNAA